MRGLYQATRANPSLLFLPIALPLIGSYCPAVIGEVNDPVDRWVVARPATASSPMLGPVDKVALGHSSCGNGV